VNLLQVVLYALPVVAAKCALIKAKHATASAKQLAIAVSHLWAQPSPPALAMVLSAADVQD
jgi:hypothetical protein